MFLHVSPADESLLGILFPFGYALLDSYGGKSENECADPGKKYAQVISLSMFAMILRSFPALCSTIVTRAGSDRSATFSM